MITLSRHVSGLLVAASLAGCASSPAPKSSTTATASSMTHSAQALSDFHWSLASATNANGQTEAGWLNTGAGPASLLFQNGRVSVTGLCNNMFAPYVVQGQSIQISRLAGTMKMCPNETLMRYEQQFALRLSQASSWQITQGDPANLTLSFKNGDQWVFAGRATHEAQYGGPGETVFLEVAPERVACSHPLIPQHQCLNVREVSYNASGIKQQVGQWQLFYDEIENYQHHAGVRNILRLKRYARPQVPADASRYVYVLDMVVESEDTSLSGGKQ